jgi:S-adenosylmethionine-diacylglycerol 3-amino-3-carboxypropyl transferase
MTKHNPIQFSVVREDPEIERKVILSSDAKEILLIASGGCTALSLQAYFPDLKFTLVDPNLAQIKLIQEKIEALNESPVTRKKADFNIENDSSLALNQRGNFESLFRLFRNFVTEFIVNPEELKELLTQSAKAAYVRTTLFEHKYWKVAFDLFFHHNFLEAMFGPDAVQHAPKGTYPDYFCKIIEQGLEKKDMSKNYFIHHIFLGHYIDQESSLPYYLAAPTPKYQFEFINNTIDKVANFSSFDMVNLSNIFDWMDEDKIKNVANRLNHEMKPGSRLLIRQLNNQKDFMQYFSHHFELLCDESAELLASDRSLFYSQINSAVKVS